MPILLPILWKTLFTIFYFKSDYICNDIENYAVGEWVFQVINALLNKNIISAGKVCI